MVNPDLLVVRKVTELEEASAFDPGDLLFAGTDGILKRMSTDSFYQILNNFARPIAPSDTGPFTADRWYKPTTSSPDPGTNYPNAGNLKAINGYDTLFWYDGTTWTKAEVALPGIIVASTFDPTDTTKAQSGKTISDYFNFQEKAFSHELNFARNSYQRYTRIFNTVTLKEGTGSLFGNMNFLKLTGGDLNFDTNFVAQQGSGSYVASKTNLITTWYEYGKVRYFIENFDIEALTFDSKIKTYYNFTNKTANAGLSTLTADYGSNFGGDTAKYNINSAGTMLVTNTAAATFVNTININKGSLTNWKVTMFMGFGAHALFSINDVNGTTYTDYLRVMKGSPNTTLRHQTPGGPVDTTTTLVPPTATTGYLWEIEVRGNVIKIFINSSLAIEYTTTQTGNYFSMGFTAVGDFINSFRLEEL